MPSPSFPAHNEQQDRTKSIRSKSMNGHNFFHHHPLKRTCDSAFPSQSSQVESREKSAKDKTQSVTGNTLPASSAAASTHIGRWTKKEHELFIEGLKLYGKSWKKISSLVITRTLVQIRTHAQKYLQKQSKNAQKAAAAAAASGSSSSASTNSSKARQQQRCGAQKQNGKHLDAWKGQRGLVPISFPDILL
uniref:Uncharacterized protein n=1 Tax=Globisporangium ultimum (strain ATCC 200006 / CBS 805.95 / DAOM BR144) TaxID=431595 RepID=K3W5W7_GLOUD